MLNDLGIPEHLIWKLNDFDNHQRAVNFIKQFQDTLCVYSAPVEQLYTNYDISIPPDDDRSLVILPNPYAYHDTFNSIGDHSVHATGMYIVPGDLFGKEGLFLTLRLLKYGKRVIKRRYQDSSQRLENAARRLADQLLEAGAAEIVAEVERTHGPGGQP